MAIRLFGKHRNKTEKKAEMKYNEGMTFIANGYWEEAFAPICEAAELGHRGATGQLAMMYFFGKGCECNKNEGMRLLKLSAEMGNPYSCYAFAALFDNGAAGITAEEAETMCRIAAEAGVEEAEETKDRLKRIKRWFFSPEFCGLLCKTIRKRGRSRKEI